MPYTTVRYRLYETMKAVVFFSALTHLLILFLYVIIRGEWGLLNYFNIIDVDLFFSRAAQGGLSHAISIALFFLLCLAIFVFKTKRMQK